MALTVNYVSNNTVQQRDKMASCHFNTPAFHINEPAYLRLFYKPYLWESLYPHQS